MPNHSMQQNIEETFEKSYPTMFLLHLKEEKIRKTIIIYISICEKNLPLSPILSMTHKP